MLPKKNCFNEYCEKFNNNLSHVNKSTFLHDNY